MKRNLLTIMMALTSVFALNAKVVLTEDFSLFTAGTDQAPDMTNLMMDLTGMTQTPGWSGMYVCQAGGSAYLPAGANLITPALDLSANNGSFVVRFKAKSDANPAMVLMSDMYMSAMNYVQITSEWQEYSLTLDNGGPNYMIAFQAMYSDFYIDDIVVDDQGVDIPVALPSSNFTKDSFTANWMEAGGATSYLLDVFTYEYNYETTTFDPVYLFKGKEVTGTSYEVTEGEFDIPYYYNVSAKNGSSVSQPSQRITVFPTNEEVVAPVANEATNVAADKFTASWNASDIATKYYLQVLKIHTAKEQETYTLVDTDFSEFTEGTMDQPQKEMEYLMEGDWSVNLPLMAEGVLGLNNEDPDFFGCGQLASPVITLNGENRTFSMTFKALSQEGIQKAMVKLYTVAENGQMTETVSQEFDLTNEWADYTFELKGTEGTACVLALTSNEKGKWFIDDLKATVNLNAEEVLPLPVRTYVSKELTCDVKDLTAGENDKVAYAVTASWAVRQQENVVMQIPEVKSAMSNIVMVDLITGLNSVDAAAQAKVAVRCQSLVVTNPLMAGVAIYTVDGRQVARTASAPESAIFTVAQPGYYIVVVGKETFKVYVGQ